MTPLIESAYTMALRLYPADYRARFALEMSATFREAMPGRRRDRVVFALAELPSVVFGAGREWLAKSTSDPVARGRTLPDCRLMRPVGVTRQEWAAGLASIEPDHDSSR